MSIHPIRPHLLVLGGTGFIGYHLILSAKKKGWKVTSVSLSQPKKYRYVDGVNYLKINITNLKEMKKKLITPITYVVNLSGYVNHASFGEEGKMIINTHFLGLVNLTKFLFKKKIKKFVQIGSGLEYGSSKAPQNEKQYGLPSSPYALAKLASTRFLLMLYNTKKFPVTILRFFQVYGPKQDQNRILPQVIKGCLGNKKFPTSAGNQIRDFCYVDDVVNAIFLTLNSKNVCGKIFNIGSGKPIKIKYAIKRISKIMGIGRPQFGAIKYRKDENMKMYPDIKKAQTILKWKPKIDFTQGIKVVINSYR